MKITKKREHNKSIHLQKNYLFYFVIILHEDVGLQETAAGLPVFLLIKPDKW